MQWDISDQLFSLTWTQRKKSQTKYPAELVPFQRLSNNSNSHASETIIAAECLCLINCGYAPSTFVWRSCVGVCMCVCWYKSVFFLCVHECVPECRHIHIPVVNVRVCANCQSMSLLISIRDVALLWFGGMEGKGLEVADQDRQKSPRIPFHHQLPAHCFSLMFLSISLPLHTDTRKPFSSLIN